MKPLTQKALVLAISASAAQMSFGAESLGEALKESTATGDFRMRYEDVDNSAIDSDGLTLRSRIGLKTGTYENFSAVVEFEDVRDLLGIDDEGGLILDPEVTEVDQAFIQYKDSSLTAKVGRQVIALDNQRYIGHVGWRQDRQTFDAARFTFAPAEGVSVDLAYIYGYNRIVAEDSDRDASSFVVNASYAMDAGKLTGYAYLLEDETVPSEIDTYGVRFSGSTKGDTSFLYTAEYATQSSGDFDADYMLLEGGVKVSGVTAKLGYELRGSDDGAYGFSTPLATGHAFNGWADIYLAPGADGMANTYLSVAGKAGPVSLLAVYHDYDSDEGSTDKGDEINLQATMPLGGGITGGIKYATYSQGDAGTTADRDKLWIWAGYKF